MVIFLTKCRKFAFGNRKTSLPMDSKGNRLRFTKMHGAGNDYIYVYTPECSVDDPAETSRRLSRPHFGIGADGLILIGKGNTPETDFTMRIFNADGSEAMMCGNGIRCVAKYVYDHRLATHTDIRIGTPSGVKTVRLLTEQGQAVAATVDMGVPRLGDAHLAQGIFVSMGNPHLVCFVDDAEALDLTHEGPRLEWDNGAGERCNVEFAQLCPDGSLRVRVWERGSGVTMACGTGACAAAVAAHATGRTGRKVTVEMDGGRLEVEWREADGHVWLTGGAETVFEGCVSV